MSYSKHVEEGQSQRARAAIITLSDTRSAETDKTGLALRRALESAGHEIASYEVIKDEPKTLRDAMDRLLNDESIDAIFTNGGTGISNRDQTIDVIETLIDKPLPGFGELFRMLGWEQIGSGAMLSRAVGGIARGKIVFAMPGSTKAAELAMSKLILPELGHLLHELRK